MKKPNTGKIQTPQSNPGVGYENDVCHFCQGLEAGYQRADNAKPRGPFFDACEACARKPYPQPAQLKAAES
jgi:hypothetical protein